MAMDPPNDPVGLDYQSKYLIEQWANTFPYGGH